jgi:hypothetical protein
MTLRLLIVLLSTLIVSQSASAEFARIRVITEQGLPVAGVRVTGNHGLTRFGVQLTNSLGEWRFDTAVLNSPVPLIALSGADVGMALEPAEIQLTQDMLRGEPIVVTARPSSCATFGCRCSASRSSYWS